MDIFGFMRKIVIGLLYKKHGRRHKICKWCTGDTDATMTDRMAGCSYFRVDEITRVAKLLDIPESDYYRFFFASENYPSAQCGHSA